MGKRQTHKETNGTVRPAAARPDLRVPAGSQVRKVTEVMSGCGSAAKQQNKQVRFCVYCCQRRKQQINEVQRAKDSTGIQIHSLSVERYREIYNSVLQPSVLATLSSFQPTDYVPQVLELKQRLWTKLSAPVLQETVREDGRVEVKEIFDLTKM